MQLRIGVSALMGFVLSTMLASSVGAQASLRIRVIDAETGRGVNAARVTINGTGGPREAQTDASGVVTVEVPGTARYQINVSAPAYKQEKATEAQVNGLVTAVEIKLTPDPIRLEPVKASAPARFSDLEVSGFYERKDQNRGVFFDQTQIQSRNQRRLSNLLRVVPGARMVPGTGSDMAVWFQGNETLGTGRLGVSLCGPRVILNGLELNRDDTSKPTPIDNLVVLSDLAGIEIYRRPSQLPARFGGAMSACGVIVLWTRLRS